MIVKRIPQRYGFVTSELAKNFSVWFWQQKGQFPSQVIIALIFRKQLHNRNR